jgi:hypothetical protein
MIDGALIFEFESGHQMGEVVALELAGSLGGVLRFEVTDCWYFPVAAGIR